MLAQLLCKRQQKAPNSDARESRAVTQVQRREDVKSEVLVLGVVMEHGEVALVQPDRDLPIGLRIL